MGVGQYRPGAHASHDRLPGHDTKVPGGHAVALHRPGRSQRYPMGHRVWPVARGSGQ